MLKRNASTGGKHYKGASGVRPKECVESDQEESTQRTSMHKVNKIGHYCASRSRVKLSVNGYTGIFSHGFIFLVMHLVKRTIFTFLDQHSF